VFLLLNRFVPLALALIAPIIVGIVSFHLFLAPSTIGPASPFWCWNSIWRGLIGPLSGPCSPCGLPGHEVKVLRLLNRSTGMELPFRR